MDVVLVLLGIAAQVLAQRKLARSPAGIWVTMGVLFAFLTPLTLLTGVIEVGVSPRWFAIGAVTGGLLYMATQLFLVAVRPWQAFTNDVHRLYRERTALSLAVGIPLGTLIAAGEELFWRGLVIAVLTPSLGVVGAGAISLAIFIGVNAVSLSRPVVAGALVGGAVWTWLASFSSGGLLAAITCHVAWTVLMIAFPGRNIEHDDLHSADAAQPLATEEIA